MQEHLDVFMSHDWPCGIENYGNLAQLLKRKPHFMEDIKGKRLGSPALRYFLDEKSPYAYNLKLIILVNLKKKKLLI